MSQTIRLKIFYLLVLCLFSFMWTSSSWANEIESSRTLLPSAPALNKSAQAMAPGYCDSWGGSHLYEYISNVVTSKSGNTMIIAVEIYIANPTNCTSGSPCPEYDNSPEYINVWIDWDGDKIWESNEKVMDVALTGYLGINYQGTMTWTSQVTIPPSAVSTTWLRANLGWGYDPNNPCEYSWVWGDVRDQEVTIEKAVIKVKELEVSGNEAIKDVSNPIWSQAYDSEGNPTGNPVQKPIADVKTSTFNLTTKLRGFPSSPPPDLQVECNWVVYPHDPGVGSATLGTGKFTGQQGTFEIRVPLKVGIYSVSLNYTFKDEDNVVGAHDITLNTLFLIYSDNVNPVRTVKRLDKACRWASGASNEIEICNKVMEGIYDLAKWEYVGSYSGWESLVEDNTSKGNCKDFAEVWHNLCQVLGVPNTYLEPNQLGAYKAGFLTIKPAVALDGKTGNAYPQGKAFQDSDRWLFGMHKIGKWSSKYYDPTLRKIYSTNREYIEWDMTDDPGELDADGFYYIAKKGSTEYVKLYLRTSPGTWTWGGSACEYFGPYAGEPPAALIIESSDLITDLYGVGKVISFTTNGARFTESHSDSAIDIDGDGINNILSIKTDVEVTVAGHFTIVGSLTRGDTLISMRPNNNSSTFSIFDLVSVPSIQTISIDFSGEDILGRGIDGPYVVHLILMDENSSVIDSLTFNTRSYTHSQFGEIFARATSCSDHGTDLNSNGLYEYLSTDITISATKIMQYGVKGILMKDTLNIAAAFDTATLNVGNNTVTLNFRGEDIREAQVNGPYSLVILIQDENETPIFTKECTTSIYDFLQFEPKKGKLEGYFDHGRDFNGNGLFDVLTVGALVRVEEAGNYRLAGWLKDVDGNEIGFAEGMAFLDGGQDTIPIDFKGTRIFENGKDGPYILNYASLEKEDGTVLDDKRDAYSTSNYSYLAFERPIPPLVALTGKYEDFGEDTDGDGLFNYLTTGVEVTCKDAGYVVGNARLVGPSGEEILWTTNHTQVAANAPKMLPLNFDGRYIYGNLENGPYRLRDLLVYHTGDPSQAVSLSEPYTTSFYNYSQFEKSGVVTGSVSDADDMPIANVFLSIEGVDNDYTNAEGHYNLTVLQNGTNNLKIEPPPGYEVDAWSIYVNDIFVGKGNSVNVNVTVGAITKVDFKIPTEKLNIHIEFLPNVWYTTWVNDLKGLIRCYIGEFPEGYGVNQIDITSPRLNDVLQMYGTRYRIVSSWPGFTGSVLEVPFSRCDAFLTLGAVTPGELRSVSVSGQLNDGTKFWGEDTITVQSQPGKTSVVEIPQEFVLVQNYPNPFNPETDIEYALPVDCQVKLTIYNILGQKVTTLVDEYQTAGYKTVHWNGKDEKGNLVSSGIYFYKVQAGDYTATKKMVMMK